MPWVCLLVLLAAVGVVDTGCAGDSAGAEVAADGEAPEGADGEAAGERSSANEEADEGSGDDSEEADDEDEPKKKKRRERSTTVQVTEVVRGDLVLPIVAEGSIRARNAAEIKFEIAGRIDELWIEEGQRVRRGQKLAGIDDREYRLQLEEARSRYLQALGQLAVEEEGYDGNDAERLLEQETDELEKLEQDGTITRRERLDRELELGMEAVRAGAYRRELLEVRSGLATARADAERAELLLERTVLRAPFSGVVVGLDVARGERVQVGETLARLVDDVDLEAEVGVLESDLGALSPGRAVLLAIPALGETLEVSVDVISPDIDAESRTCPVLMRIKSKDGRIKPGMFVRAAIAGEVLPGRILVPREAIVTRDGRPVLFRVEDGRAKWVYVQLGERNDHLVEIARVDQGGPLDPGTPVVVDNHLTLTHDAKVKVRRTVPVADPWFEQSEVAADGESGGGETG
jgi:RND family efflux transporter MFP subunit